MIPSYSEPPPPATMPNDKSTSREVGPHHSTCLGPSTEESCHFPQPPPSAHINSKTKPRRSNSMSRESGMLASYNLADIVAFGLEGIIVINVYNA